MFISPSIRNQATKMEAFLPLLIQLIAGVAGSHVAAKIRRSISIGLICNTMAGIVGGSAGGLVLGLMSAENWILSVVAGFFGGVMMLGLVSGLRNLFEK